MKYGIIALVLGILILAGAFVLWKSGQETESMTPPVTTQQTAQNRTVQQNATEPSDKQSAPTASQDKSVDQVQRLMKEYPGENSTNQQKSDYAGKVFQASVSSNILDVSQCKPNPAIMQVKKNQLTITVKNSDSVAHTVYHGQFTFKAQPNSESKVSLNITPGIYSYSCDTVPAGIIMVVD